MKKHTSWTIIIPCMLLATACYKDKGNYDYIALNETSIAAEDTVTVGQFDTLKITPQITRSKGSGESLTYSWYYFEYGGSRMSIPENQYLSTEKNLNKQINALPGTYSLYLEATDPATGISEFHHFYMKVTNRLSQGWLVMYDQGGDSSDVALIMPGNVVVRDLYAKVNGKRIAGHAKSIAAFSSSYFSQYIFGLTDKSTVLTSSIDFSKLGDFESSFYGGPPAVKKPEAIHPSVGTDFYQDFLYNDGKVYSRPWFGMFISKYGAAAGGDYYAAPFMMGSPYLQFGPYPVVIYDETHHRFLYIPLNQSDFKTFTPDASAPFDLTDMGNKTLLYAHCTDAGMTSAVFKSTANDSIFFFQLDFSVASPAVSTHVITNSPGLAGSRLFTMSPTLPLLYYARDNKLFKYDIAANSSQLLYTFPAGETVTAIRILNPQRGARFPAPENYGKRLVAGTYDGAAGTVYEFAITPTGIFAGNTFLNRYEGFGRVGSFYYKIPQ